MGKGDSSELALFLDMLSAERGAAAHTIEAYTRDLSEFLAYLAVKGKDASDATAEQLKSAAAAHQVTGITMPIVKKVNEVEFAAITEADKKKKVYHTLRTIRTNHRYKGRREKRANDDKKAKE